MPKWMECTWRRIACGKDDCPICGRIKRDRQSHIEKGKDPDNIKCVFEDLGRNFKEILQRIKKDAKKRGFNITNIDDIKEPPEPEEFPFYNEVKKWRDALFEIVQNAEIFNELWINTEAGKDLTWYANLLPAKVYRQLCNKWEIKNGADYGDFDYEYTQKIIKECLKILKKAFADLDSYDFHQKSNLMLVYCRLLNLEKNILKI